jgi:formiminotetrahydrofolate cyclodeaminase
VKQETTPDSLESLLERLASSEPTPGGGAAAALAGALAAALVAMVGRVTLRRSASNERVGALVAAADRIRERLTSLVGEDARAYRQVLEARRRGPEGRAAAFRPAMRRATEVPLEVARLSAEVVGLCGDLVSEAPGPALGDLGAAASLAAAALEAASLTARINLGELSDAGLGRQGLAELDRLATGAARGRERVATAISERI